MVVQKSRSTQVAEMRSDAPKNYFRRAFAHSMTVYPLKFDEIPSGYISPVLYTGMLGSISTAIYLASSIIEPGTKDARDMLLKYIFGASAWTLYFLLASFLSSWIGARIAGIEHSSKQFGLVVSSLTYICILSVLIVTGLSTLLYVARVAGSLLMSYYVHASYQESVAYQDSRGSTIHGIWIFICCILFPYINDVTFMIMEKYKY